MESTPPPRLPPPPTPERPVHWQILHTLGAYVKGQIQIASIMAGVYLVGYGALGVPFWPVIGVISGALHLVPFAGAVLGLILPLAASYLGGADLYRLLGVLGVYIFAQALEGFYLSPKILGRRLSLHPLMVFFAVIIGGAIFGPLGILLAAPVAAVAALLWRRVRERRAGSPSGPKSAQYPDEHNQAA
jgi:predicted PurR-regulated permease PerM